MWCVAELDEEYIRRMEDILAVYEKPLSEREPVVCVDEKPVVLHQEVRPPQTMRPGRIARRDGEYQRCGTANVFCRVQPKAAALSVTIITMPCAWFASASQDERVDAAAFKPDSLGSGKTPKVYALLTLHL